MIKKMTKSENEGGFVSHLTELRKRLIHSFIFLFIFFIVCYFFSENLYAFLVEPYALAVKENGLERRLIFTALQETFLTYLKVSFFGPFYGTYAVFELADDYSYAFVSGYNTDYLWLLAREPQVSPDVRERFIAQSKSLGFETDDLIWVVTE